MEIKILIFTSIVFITGLAVILGAGLFLKDKESIRALRSLFLTEFIIVGLVIAPAFSGKYVFFAAMTFIAVKSQYELIRTTINQPGPFLTGIALFAGILIMAGAWRFNEAIMLDLVLISVALLLVANLGIPENTDQGKMIGPLSFSLVFPVCFSGFLLLLYNLPRGVELVLFLYVVSEVNNSFAQVMGRIFGKKKLFPKLSPNKTYGGLFWGVFTGLAAGLAFNYAVLGFAVWKTVWAIILILICTLLGDMVASRIKREANVKDFGIFLPINGGVLDVYDSFIFSAPFFYGYSRLLMN